MLKDTRMTSLSPHINGGAKIVDSDIMPSYRIRQNVAVQAKVDRFPSSEHPLTYWH